MASPASVTEELVAQIILSLIPRTLLCDFQTLLWGSLGKPVVPQSKAGIEC